MSLDYRQYGKLTKALNELQSTVDILPGLNKGAVSETIVQTREAISKASKEPTLNGFALNATMILAEKGIDIDRILDAPGSAEGNGFDNDFNNAILARLSGKPLDHLDDRRDEMLLEKIQAVYPDTKMKEIDSVLRESIADVRKNSGPQQDQSAGVQKDAGLSAKPCFTNSADEVLARRLDEERQEMERVKNANLEEERLDGRRAVAVNVAPLPPSRA